MPEVTKKQEEVVQWLFSPNRNVEYTKMGPKHMAHYFRGWQNALYSVWLVMFLYRRCRKEPNVTHVGQQNASPTDK